MPGKKYKNLWKKIINMRKVGSKIEGREDEKNAELSYNNSACLWNYVMKLCLDASYFLNHTRSYLNK